MEKYSLSLEIFQVGGDLVSTKVSLELYDMVFSFFVKLAFLGNKKGSKSRHQGVVQQLRELNSWFIQDVDLVPLVIG